MSEGKDGTVDWNPKWILNIRLHIRVHIQNKAMCQVKPESYSIVPGDARKKSCYTMCAQYYQVWVVVF